MKSFTPVLKFTLHYAFAGLLGLSLLSSCKKDDPYDFEDSTTHARVNFINASPDGPSAQLYVDDVLRTPTEVTFGNASGYYNTFVGEQGVVIKSASGNATLSSSNSQFDIETSYTFFLVGQNSSLGMVGVTDDLTAPAAGRAKIRFVNASPNATSATLNNGTTVLVGAQNFRGVAPSTEVSDGSYTLRVVSGLISSAPLNISLESGKIYTIYAKGLVGGTGAAAFSVSSFTNK